MTEALDNATKGGAARGTAVRPVTVTCSWCGLQVMVPAKGRVPKWCGTSCRHRAWEQTRAAASGRSAVQIVERVVERVVSVQPPPRSPSRPQSTVPPPSAAVPSGGQWVPLLTELARQLDTGRIYTRDISAILPAFEQAVQALNRRLPH